MSYLAFDLGASSGKLFRGDFDGEKLSIEPVHSFKNGVVNLNGALYWDFFGIWKNLCYGITKASMHQSIVSLGIDSFNNDFSFVDKKGELLFPIRAYRDPRTIQHEKVIYERLPKEQLYMLTGNQIAPFNTYMQLAAMVENGQSYLFEEADNLMMLPDLLMYYLTGNRVIEYTLAAEMQLFSMVNQDWIKETLDAIGFPKRLLPNLQAPGTKLGSSLDSVCREMGVDKFMCVNVCEHDTASAFLSAPVTEPAAIISSGTWSIVGVEVELPCITQYGYDHNIANEGGFPGHHRLLKNVMGSWILQELIRDFELNGEHYDYESIQALALEAKPFCCMINVDDRRFYSPGNMLEKMRNASIETTGNAPETPGEFFRTVYEGLSFKYRQALEELEKVTGHEYSRVHIIGGGSIDQLACRFAASAMNRDVLAGPVDGSAIGNILVQLIAHNEIASVEQGRELLLRSHVFKQYSPENSAHWAEKYELFCEYFF